MQLLGVVGKIVIKKVLICEKVIFLLGIEEIIMLILFINKFKPIYLFGKIFQWYLIKP